MSAKNNNNETEVKNSINNNIDDKNSSDSQNPPTIHVIPNTDNISLKSETTSLSRPLKFSATDPGHTGLTDTTHNQSKDKFSNAYNVSEIQKEGTLSTRSSRFPTLIHCQSDSTEEKTVCCTNLALNLYNKALESAKRALPHKTKRGPQFPRSFGEDFGSIGPEGFNYLDDGQTECSYDYRDIEFNRESLFRPDVLAQNTELSFLVTDPSLEPTNLSELQAKYGLPEEPERVQPYKPTQTINNLTQKEKTVNSKFNNKKSEPKTEVAINKDSDITTDTTDTTTNTIEAGIIVRSRPPSLIENQLTQALTATPEPVPSTSSFISESVPIDFEQTVPNTSAMEVNTITPQIIIESEVKEPSPGFKTRPLRMPSDTHFDNMDQLAKRTSQLIIENAFESIAKSKAEETQKDINEKPSKKSSTESNTKDLKKEKKLLDKKLKEEEKNRKKQEKESKDMERKERKKLFDRFRSDDKQKRKIQKKQKEFEKIKRKMSEKNQKDSTKVDLDADIEADDEYEPQEGFRDRPYEDIDDKQNEETSVSLKVSTDEPSTAEVIKIENFGNIKEIGVTYVPSDDGIENENYVEENEPKLKSKSSSFRIPRIESFKTKVIGIFPKKTQKTEKKSDLKSEDLNANQNQVLPEIVVNSGDNQRKIPEYENVDETTTETKVRPTVTYYEPNASQWETEDEERQQFLERVSKVESPKIGAKKRKKSKTKAKLDRFKAKAIESLPNIKAIVPKVKGLVGRKEEQNRDMDYERFISEHSSRHRYDSDFDCVSDSELCDSLRRKGIMSGGLGRHHVYEEMAATQERVDAYMSPVAGPLRPPRRFSSLKNIQKVSSVPVLATQVLLKPKRIPPPRPPPPRPPPPKALPMVTITIDSSSRANSLKRRTKQRVPPEIYYNNLRMNFKPKRRFVNLKPKHMEVLATYDEPKPPLPIYSKQQKPTVKAMRAESLRKVNQKNALNTALTRSLSMPLKEKFLQNNIITDMKIGPTPPPRRKQKPKRSQTIDPLDWQPFTWKSRRCRSLTELDVRKKRDVRSNRTHNYENIAPKESSKPRTPRPLRPPLPKTYYSSNSLHSSKRYFSDNNNFHIYASISRKGPNANRPLPPPPVPPRPKFIPVKGGTPLPKTRDVSVSTKDNGLIVVCEKQTQIDARNQSICEDVNGNVELELELALDAERTPTNPLTPTTPTNQTQVVFPQTRVVNINRGLAQQCEGLKESTGTLSSITTTSWFDAEYVSEPNPHPYKDYDEDTLNDDISSLASVYQSFSSDVTVTLSREQTPVPEPEDDETPPIEQNKRSAPKPAVRSNSTKLMSEIESEKPVKTRRSLPLDNIDSEDNEEMFGMSREMHSELKNILEKRISDLSSERPNSLASSETSLREQKF